MEIPRHWRLKAKRYRMEGVACSVCCQLTFPPRRVGPDCAYLAVGTLAGNSQE